MSKFINQTLTAQNSDNTSSTPANATFVSKWIDCLQLDTVSVSAHVTGVTSSVSSVITGNVSNEVPPNGNFPNSTSSSPMANGWNPSSASVSAWSGSSGALSATINVNGASFEVVGNISARWLQIVVTPAGGTTGGTLTASLTAKNYGS